MPPIRHPLKRRHIQRRFRRGRAGSRRTPCRSGQVRPKALAGDEELFAVSAGQGRTQIERAIGQSDGSSDGSAKEACLFGESPYLATGLEDEVPVRPVSICRAPPRMGYADLARRGCRFVPSTETSQRERPFFGSSRVNLSLVSSGENWGHKVCPERRSACELRCRRFWRETGRSCRNRPAFSRRETRRRLFQASPMWSCFPSDAAHRRALADSKGFRPCRWREGDLLRESRWKREAFGGNGDRNGITA